MSDMGEVIGVCFKFMTILLAVCLPLAAWKLIDILIWLFQHLRFMFV